MSSLHRGRSSSSAAGRLLFVIPLLVGLLFALAPVPIGGLGVAVRAQAPAPSTAHPSDLRGTWKWTAIIGRTASGRR